MTSTVNSSNENNPLQNASYLLLCILIIAVILWFLPKAIFLGLYITVGYGLCEHYLGKDFAKSMKWSLLWWPVVFIKKYWLENKK